MPLSTERKAVLVKQYGQNEKDTGTTEVQIAILSDRISAITEHLKIHRHDNHTRYGLLKLVGQRRSLLDYLKENHIERYRQVIAKVGIRK